MNLKIYLDVLVITNCILNLIILQCVCKITHTKISHLRLFLSSFIGGISSLLVIVNPNGMIKSIAVTILKILLIGVIIVTAFGLLNAKRFIRYIFLYFFINLIFAGISLLLWQITDSSIIYIKNYTVYFDISLLHLVAAAIIIYIVITVYEWILRRKNNSDENYRAKYSVGNYEIEMPAIADSGNKLCDSFTGTPVVIFYCSELYEHFNLENENQYALGGFRVTPFSTVSGNGVIPITSKGNVVITDSGGNSKCIKCCTGILKNENNKSRAIFNPCLLQ